MKTEWRWSAEEDEFVDRHVGRAGGDRLAPLSSISIPDRRLGALNEADVGRRLLVDYGMATTLVSVPMPSIVIETMSPCSSVNSGGGTTPAPVIRKQPDGNDVSRVR
jgi:hypothetical protein